MPDDPSKQAKDRKLVSEHQPYELYYFKKKWGLTTEQARTIIRRYGPSRKRCNAAALALLQGVDGKVQ